MAGNPTSDFVDLRLFEGEIDEVLKPSYKRPNDPDDDEEDEDEDELELCGSPKESGSASLCRSLSPPPDAIRRSRRDE